MATMNDTAFSAVPRRRWRRGMLSLLGLLPLALLLLVWQLVQQGPSPYFPRPSLWADALVKLAVTGKLWPALWATVQTFLESLVIATLLGSVLGMLIGRRRRIAQTTGPLFEFFRVIPAAAVVPVAVLFGGYTESMKIVVVVFAAIWPVLLTVQSGARRLPAARDDLARSMRLTRWQAVWKVLVPSMVPSILLGVRVAAPIVLIIVLLVEIITQVPGLGALLASGQQNYQAAQVFGIVAISGILGLLTNLLVTAVEAVATRYESR